MNMIKDHSGTANESTSKNCTPNSLKSEQIVLIRERTEEFVGKKGRRPRILVTGMDQKSHDRTTKWVASSFSEMGFDVDISLMQQTPREVAMMAVENDVHFVCATSPGNVNSTSVQRLTDALKAERGEEILIIVSGEISAEYNISFHHDGTTGVYDINRLDIDFANRLDQVEAGMEISEDIQYYIKGILDQNRRIISKAITLIESSLPAHKETARAVIDALLPHTSNALRIGITGVPGVGKSTFIESFGMTLIEKGHRVAVLAVDPSSSRSGGSIMGDKTRMERLSVEPGVFIRPSPSGGILGGVARRTREAMVVCAAAGYDVVIVETVGVGQSETTVASMVDFFLVMLLAGAGDEIQGIKKGIIELADAIAINKADGDNIVKAGEAKNDYQSALNILSPSLPFWLPPVLTCSALTMDGIDRIWKIILDHREKLEAAGELDTRRRKQALAWMWDLVEEGLKDRFYQNPEVNKLLPKIIKEVKKGKKVSSAAAYELLFLNR